ncbi:hypothetical protein [Bythopirellula polymerisocia]|uniref:Uncharacterized protein n=1 Tax=Bythopirellula polymerisocia TaxID=2528003 RepID=A0A5C6CZ32_9BACT|nr:hypothetical protein [Bythopirellula polymerisocia]TWU30193.1 hypothetical protein Pla144_09790 [Bythopirellula polymerisocia]
MPPRMLFFALAIVTMFCQSTYSESTSLENNSQDPQESPLTTLIGGEMVRAANDFHKGSVALERSGETLQRILSSFGNELVSISENFAAMSTGFDPLGMKSAMKTIARQNEVIKEQTEMIQELQEQEIRRLRKEVKQLKRRK